MTWQKGIAVATLVVAALGVGVVVGHFGFSKTETREATVTVATTDMVTFTSTTTRTEASVGRVFVPTPTGDLDYKPAGIPFGATNGIEEIQWASYDLDSAFGSGYTYIRDCMPNCADGNTRRVRVRFRLTDLGVCRGAVIYRKLTIEHPEFSSEPIDISPLEGCE